MKLSRTQAHRALAYHEAGHAVIQEVIGLPVRYVVLGRWAHVEHRSWPKWVIRLAGTTKFARLSRRKSRLISDIVATIFAGRISEELWLKPQGLRPQLPITEYTDYWSAWNLLRAYGVRLNSREVRRHVTALVKEHWSSIAAVARAALRRGRLTGTQVRRVIASAKER